VRGRQQGSPDEDRWSRADWWGVVVDSPDPQALARFYSDLLGWPIWKSDPEGAALDLGQGVGYLSFQLNPDYVRPTWPGEPDRQQMMLHLDFEVTDLADAVGHARELGAEQASFQPQDNVRVMLDPDGHPFCLYT
jgi:catechol 2,3-dioxygenase-like lactoylglutathione lyase family enzyme